MTGSTMQGAAYGAPAWGFGPGWHGHRFWSLPFAARPLWIAAVVLAFIAWWPVGLALLFFLIGSGRMGCRGYRHHGGGWDRGPGWSGWSGPWAGWRGFCGEGRSPDAAPSSGNRAFDEYRADTLRRLEEEQRAFSAFLDRLRFAKDKAEFDQFMAERRPAPERPDEPPAGPTPIL